MAVGKFKELLKKYGKVAVGIHFSVSAASITGLYIAIKNNVAVESLFDKFHLPGISKKDSDSASDRNYKDLEENSDGFVTDHQKKRNRTAELAASTGGALALAVLCNKALIPVRLPITFALNPPIARFLARRKIIKTSM